MMAAPSGTGILIGRFQFYEINDALHALITSIAARHERLVIFLGSNPAPSDLNPLEWPLRQEMLLEAFDDELEIQELPDVPDDRNWSQELDRRIMDLRPAQPVTIYGTMDGFVERYSGRYETQPFPIDPEDMPYALDVDGIRHLGSFRAGIMYATLRRFPTVYPTVDIAVFSADYQQLLLARKEHEIRFRFPGGFTDPTDESYEMAALRELAEECGELEVEDLTYIGSCKVDDWRYRGSLDGIITHLYTCVLVSGNPAPNDDIVELRWFDVQKLKTEMLTPEHRPLLDLLMEFLTEEPR
jgi:bifunctional NMN adenylyltransferase/nudix hydrolase